MLVPGASRVGMFLRTGLTKSEGAQEGVWDNAVKRILAAYKIGACTVWLPRADKLEQPLLRQLWAWRGQLRYQVTQAADSCL